MGGNFIAMKKKKEHKGCHGSLLETENQVSQLPTGRKSGKKTLHIRMHLVWLLISEMSNSEESKIQ